MQSGCRWCKLILWWGWRRGWRSEFLHWIRFTWAHTNRNFRCRRRHWITPINFTFLHHPDTTFTLQTRSRKGRKLEHSFHNDLKLPDQPNKQFLSLFSHSKDHEPHRERIVGWCANHVHLFISRWAKRSSGLQHFTGYGLKKRKKKACHAKSFY